MPAMGTWMVDALTVAAAAMVVAAAAVAVLAAAAASVLVVRTRRAQRRADHVSAAPYTPPSTDPRGRWRVSRFGPDLLDPEDYMLTTNHDGPLGTRLPPAVSHTPAAECRDHRH